jgi:type I restriction enzyme S subunit
MGEWKECKLEDLGLLQRGRSRHRPRYAFHLYGGKYPFIQTGEIREARKYVTKFEQTYNEAGLAQSKIWPKGTLCITIAANIAELSILSFDACFPDSVLGFIPNNEFADLDFIYYTLTHFQKELKHVGEGSVQDNINLGTFQNVLFPIPHLLEQHAIASVLSSLDDKIDLLHRQNKTLEAMAETLFRQWFVEEADEGWEECTLNDLCTQIASGGTPSTKIESYYNGNINWYSTKELKDNFLYESENKITKEGLENSSAKLFLAGTVVIAIYAAPTVGRLGILANEASFNQAACGLIANEEFCCSEFIYIHLKNQRDELNLMASGSAQQNLNVSKIKSFPAFKVSKDLMNKFKNTIQPNFKKINSNTLQIHTLEKLRDMLLPKLMSGEVGVEMEASL